MKPEIIKANMLMEYFSSERCFISENFSSPEGKISVARARVAPGVATVTHHLKGVDEIYLVTSGIGKIEVGNLKPAQVGVGDLIFIPANTSQRITNVGKKDVVFYCICTPAFTSDSYVEEIK